MKSGPSRAEAVRLVAVGDLQLGDSATCVGFGFRSKVSASVLETGLTRFFSGVGPADIVFGNLETPLSDAGLNSTRRSRQLRGRPEYAPALRASGFSVLNVANNHALEHGHVAFATSVSQVEATGISVCGRAGSDGWATRPVTQSVKGMRVSFLSYSMRPATEPAAGTYANATETEILAD